MNLQSVIPIALPAILGLIVVLVLFVAVLVGLVLVWRLYGRWSAAAEERRRLAAEEREAHRRRAQDLAQERRAALVSQYGLEVVDCIDRHHFCRGMPSAALRMSLGSPADIDERVSKTKTVQTWKYQRTGKGSSYALRIMLENDRVTGWDDKR